MARLLGVSCLFFSLASAAQNGAPLQDMLKEWQLDIPQMRDFKIDSKTSLDVELIKSEEVLASSVKKEKTVRLVRTSGLSPRAAGNLIFDRMSAIQNLFARRYDDSIIKNRQRCKPDQLKLSQPSYRTLLIMSADKSLQFGECDPKLARHHVVVALINCPNRQAVYEISYYFPLSADAKAVRDELAKIPCLNN